MNRSKFKIDRAFRRQAPRKRRKRSPTCRRLTFSLSVSHVGGTGGIANCGFSIGRKAMGLGGFAEDLIHVCFGFQVESRRAVLALVFSGKKKGEAAHLLDSNERKFGCIQTHVRYGISCVF